LTEAIPFSIEDLVEYISLEPISSPLAALRVKKASPFFEVLRSKFLSLRAAFLT